MTNSPLSQDKRPELVIGLIGPVGARLTTVVEALREELSRSKYSIQHIKLSSLLHDIEEYSSLGTKAFPTEYERIDDHMTAGTALREATNRGDIFALLSINEIRKCRRKTNKALGCAEEVPETELSNLPVPGTAYILDSLKHPREIETLRTVYGKGFISIGGYAPREARVDSLARLIADSCYSADLGAHRSFAEKLIDRDEKEAGHKLGQNVSDVFPLADLFVDVRSLEKVSAGVARYLDLLFGHPYHTPTRDEFGMFHAKAVSLRSADLGRQVGAVICTEDGDIISVGCNEVPRAGGGLYWCEDNEDHRDFRLGYDSSAKYKRRIVAEILDRLKQAEWLNDSMTSLEVSELLELALGKGKKGILDGAQVLDVIEFGRSVHAEMAALCDAARRGVPVRSCTLYTTTFPCHLCARHIVAAGIRRVVYIEPYHKSMAEPLFSDSITVDPAAHEVGRVSFEPFVGVAPSQYFSMFEAAVDRKEKNGEILRWARTDDDLEIKRLIVLHTQNEQRAMAELASIISA